jgi:integrase
VRSETLDEKRDAEDFKLLLDRSNGDSGLAERILKERYEQGPTLVELMADHIRHLTDVGPYTIEKYESYIRNYFSGVTGDLKAASISHRDVVAWIRYMQSKKLSAKTIKNVHGFLSATMNTAVRDGIRQDNPCKGVKLPKETSHEEKATFLTLEEWQKLYDCIDPFYQPFYAFLIGTGLRFSEATALKAEDFHLNIETPVVRVAKAWKQDGQGGYYLGRPKTAAGVRSVSLAPSTLRAVLPLIERAGDGLVFTTKQGMMMTHQNMDNRAWRPAKMRAGLGKNVRTHDLRHTHASLMISQGFDMHKLMARLGHTSIQMTIDLYSHIMPDAQFAGAQAATRALGEIA